jgi:molybdate transport system ATP-binding protein
MGLYVDIKKKLGNFLLDVSFEAQDEIFAILGSSGCGKSMTLKCIAGVETPDSGRIVLDGRVLFDSEKKINLPPQKRKVGYLFQNYALFPNMTVEQNIGIGAVLPKTEKDMLIKEKIKAFYLEGLEKKYPSQLSGGQQQRVALARIMASQPEIIMLDEPFSALDSFLKWQLELEMIKALENFHGTTLFVSHDRDEVYRICDRIAVLSSGRVEVIGEKKEIFKNPQTLCATQLTGCKNISKAKKLTKNSIEAIDWETVLYTNTEIPDDLKYVGMRAHYFTLAGSLDIKNTIECEVEQVIEDTFSTIVLMRNKNAKNTGGSSRLRWEISHEKWADILKNSYPLYITMPPDRLLLLR